MPVGELAGLGAAFCWAITALAFAAAGRRIGSHAVNATRLFWAIGLLGLLMLILGRSPWPWTMPPEPLGWLALSGFVGLVIGDSALFRAYVVIGPRLGSLMMALWPAVAALQGYLILGEELGPWAIGGMALTIASVAWVVVERQGTKKSTMPAGASLRPTAPGGGVGVSHARAGSSDTCDTSVQRAQSPRADRPDGADASAAEPDATPTPNPSTTKRAFTVGVLLAFVGVLGQATGIVMSKMAMLGAVERGLPPIDPLPATFTRMLAGGLIIWTIVASSGKTMPVVRTLRDRRAAVLTFFGAVCGPFLGVWLSLVSSLNTQLGIAGTLMATSPVWVIPLVMIIHKERVSWRAALGAVGALAGVAMLFLKAT